jgi:hypothetical protein
MSYFNDFIMSVFSRIILLATLLSGINCITICQSRYGDELDDRALRAVTSRGDFLYVGMDNIIKIYYSNPEDVLEYFITANNGILVRDSLDFLSIPVRKGRARFLLYKKDGSDSILLGYKFFFVKNIPKPMLTFDTVKVKERDMISKRHLLDTKKLNIFVSDDIIGSERWFKVVKYTFGYEYGGYYVEHTINSGELALKTKQIINTLGPSREIIIKPVVENVGELMLELPIYRLTLY